MQPTTSIPVELTDEQGGKTGTLVVTLPGKASAAGPQPLLQDLRDDPTANGSLEPLQLVEDAEYRYTITLEPSFDGDIDLDPKELVFPDGPDGKSGRLRPGSNTGTLRITVNQDGRRLGTVLFEVLSRKLDYLTEYQWMLGDIASTMTDLVMERFAPSEQSFELHEAADAATRLQQFAFLRSLIAGEAFDVAMQQIRARPHRAWVEEVEVRRPGQPIRMDAGIARQLARAGRRVDWPATRGTPPLPSLPAFIHTTRTEETLDTPENRFIKFALTRWRDFVADIEQALLSEPQPSAAVKRGQRETRALIDQIDLLLADQLFADVGELAHFPSGSQVLTKRAGYRELYRAYIQFESTARLRWHGGEEVYGAGKRDVATLYEYWVFLKLVDVVSRLCEQPLDRSRLLRPRTDGLNVTLRRGKASRLNGQVVRHGRKLHIRLWYNRNFTNGDDQFASWTRQMRPDYSLQIQAEPSYGANDEVWLHFDAKYRVEEIGDLLSDDTEAKREDLLKMHAYRDAIRRSVGAYVIYPGRNPRPERLPMFREILPGLGAFPLRPSKDGVGQGVDALEGFLSDVIDHLATQTTAHERQRFWARESMAAALDVPARDAVPFLNRPPADIKVLLGYVRTPEQLAWCHAHGLYNLRADPDRRGSVSLASPELAAEFVLLYGRGMTAMELWRVQGEPRIWTGGDMRMSDYEASGDLYLCLPIQPVAWGRALSHLDMRAIARLQATRPGAVPGAPVTVTWLELSQWEA